MNNKKTYIVIQSRLNSSRLPAKAMLPIAGYPAVVLCALRASRGGLPVFVVTSAEPSDGIIESTVEKFGVKCIRGSLEDVLQRYYQVARDFDSEDLIVRLTADNVFPDGDFIQLLLEQYKAQGVDYLGTKSPEDFLPYGMSAEIFSVKVLREAHQKAVTAFDREHVTPFIQRNFVSKYFKYNEAPSSWRKHRCTLDTFLDYTQLIQLFKDEDNPVQAKWHDLANKLEKISNPLREEKESIDIHNNPICPKLVFGTAQLGMKYGISNVANMLSDEEAIKLIQKAMSLGVSQFDTARAYGRAEERLGKIIGGLDANAKIITKLHPLDFLSENEEEAVVRQCVRASIFESCINLNTDHIDTLLLHRWEHRYKWNGAVWAEVLKLWQAGRIKNIGVSISTVDEALDALKEPMVQHLQCPINILDWRWRQNNFLEAISHRTDVVIYARSIYLQGLLLLDDSLWPGFKGACPKQIVAALDTQQKNFNRKSRQDLCLAYVNGLSWVNNLVIGMESERQLDENISLFNNEPLSLEQINEIHQSIPKIPEHVLNPARWGNVE